MVKNQSNLCRFPYLDNAIFSPSKMKLVLATLSQMMTVYIKMTISGDRVFEHISLAQGQTVQSGTTIPRWKMLGDVIFHNVGFTYSTRDTPVLADFNLRLQRNQTAALVGTSGNGKSTIAALLARLYDPNEGQSCEIV